MGVDNYRRTSRPLKSAEIDAVKNVCDTIKVLAFLSNWL